MLPASLWGSCMASPMPKLNQGRSFIGIPCIVTRKLVIIEFMGKTIMGKTKYYGVPTVSVAVEDAFSAH